MLVYPQPVWNKSKELFFAESTSIFPVSVKPASHLTPTGDAFKQHVLRAKVPDQHLMSHYIATLNIDTPVGNRQYMSVAEPG